MLLRVKNIIIIMALLGVFLFTGCNRSENSGKNNPAKNPPGGGKALKAAFVYSGPIGDAGWTFSHDQARRKIDQDLSFVETSYTEIFGKTGDPFKIFEKLINQGNKVIVATSAEFAPLIPKLARKYPDTIFLLCSGAKTAPNIGVFFGKMYQARYLTGLVAGKITKSGKIGYVAAHPVPEVKRGVNAFTRGVREVNPKAQVYLVWTRSWYNPAGERNAAEILLNKGCDIITQHQDTASPQNAAREYGKYSIGYNSDMSVFAPGTHLVAAVWNWEVYYGKTLEEIYRGTWKPGNYWGGLKEGIVDISPFSNKVPKPVRDMVEKRKKEIISGELDVFEGPIRDNRGKLVLKMGQKFDNNRLMKMGFLIDGVKVVGEKRHDKNSKAKK